MRWLPLLLLPLLLAGCTEIMVGSHLMKKAGEARGQLLRQDRRHHLFEGVYAQRAFDCDQHVVGWREVYAPAPGEHRVFLLDDGNELVLG